MNMENETKILEPNTSEPLQRAYRKFYDEMRNYLWDMETLEKLADLEIAIFNAFIDKDELDKAMKCIEFAIRSQMNEEDGEDLKKAFEEMKEVSEEEYEAWAPLPALPVIKESEESEVNEDENPEEESKRVRRIGDNS